MNKKYLHIYGSFTYPRSAQCIKICRAKYKCKCKGEQVLCNQSQNALLQPPMNFKFPP